ncbi:MAG: type II secretion system F family protein [Vulcanimicrobiota bacterium]
MADHSRLRVAPQKVAFFTRQLALMIRVGVPLLQALEGLQKVEDEGNFRFVLEQLCLGVSSGYSLSASMANFPGVFSELMVSMVRVAEKTGALALILDHVGEWLERDRKLASRLRSSLVYPVFVLALAAGLGWITLHFVVPQFAGLYGQLPLPWPTRLLLWLAWSTSQPWPWFFVVVVSSQSLWILRSSRLRRRWRRGLETILRRLPAVGPLLREVCLARMCLAMSFQLRAGLDPITALLGSLQASGSLVLNQPRLAMARELGLGEELSDILAAQVGCYPPIMISFVLVGSQTGNSDRMFGLLSGYFDQQVEARLQQFLAVLEPALMAAIGLMVCGLVLAVFLPLYGQLNWLD